MSFNNFYWHDAIIKEIQIDRNSPGVRDTIVFNIEWAEDQGKVKFVFEDVYWASMELNFGITADETILSALELDENDQNLKNVYDKWKEALGDVQLKIYQINLNSTAGEIKIAAKGFRVTKIY